MKNTILFPSLIGLLVASSGCASIVSDSSYPVRIESTPPGERFVIRDKSGSWVASGKTPDTVTLKAGSGYFQSARYNVEFDAGNTLEIKADVDPWFFGNIVFGGLIGFCIVDPLTGAMWELPESVSATIYKEKPRRSAAKRTSSTKRTSTAKRQSTTQKRNSR